MTDKDKEVRFEVDGRTLRAPAGSMLIRATDREGIYIPRFCYHPQLSVAANCRMCVVEVENAPKPLPACATPVAEGMKIRTRSPLALEAQKSVMEFLLINHPLDCPICDQGGECELQDLAMSFGRDVSRYQERKRVVQDQDIGPLVQTDMTRCIHCTRCVRFGEEIAGLRELGTLGRGEDLEIGVYVERSMASELSGNVIDLCPVGALTSKPFRFRARTWEMRQHPSVAPHDAVGSNLQLHVHGGRVLRVVPAENDAINEVWLSDRDRFSYEGLYSKDRLRRPATRTGESLEESDWEPALDFVAQRLRRLLEQHGPDCLGVLVSPSATVEEHYLAQRLARGLGAPHIDHRLRQRDFRRQDEAPQFPWLGRSIAELERLEAVLIVGGDPRREQPLVNHRLGKAARRGAAIMAINPVDYAFNYGLAARLAVTPGEMPATLGAVLGAALSCGKPPGQSMPREQARETASCLRGLAPEAAHRRIAEALCSHGRTAVVLGESALAHPEFSLLQTLAGLLCAASGSSLGYLPPGANAAGACLAGTLPHRGPMGQPAANTGLAAHAMLERQLRGYLLLGVEPELDCWDGRQALQALRKAELVVCMSSWCNAAMKEYAHAVLPVAQFAETSGTFVNLEGAAQSFAAAVPPPGEARPAWKVLRMLGAMLELSGFEHRSREDVFRELQPALADMRPDNRANWRLQEPVIPPAGPELQRCGEVSMYAVDPLVRRATSLQAAAGESAVRIHPALAERLALGAQVRVRQGGNELVLPLRLDARIPERCIHIPGGWEAALPLGGRYGEVQLAQA